MFYLKNSLLTLLVVVNLASVSRASFKEDDVEVKIHNVGQGNCVTLKVQEAGKEPLFMMIDAGTSSYAKETAYYSNQSPLPSTSEDLGRRKSIVTKDNYGSTVGKNPKKTTEIKREKEEFFTNMRIYFGAKNENKPIHIQTLIITHPDIDHYSWIFDIFSYKRDHN